MSIDLDVLEGLAKAATPGPWTTRTLENFGWNVVHYRNRDRFNIERVSKCAHEENAAFIAATNPETVLHLIAAARERDALAVLLDNVVIAQSLSKELRQAAHDEARSYLYARRHARQSLAPDAGEPK